MTLSPTSNVTVPPVGSDMVGRDSCWESLQYSALTQVTQRKSPKNRAFLAIQLRSAEGSPRQPQAGVNVSYYSITLYIVSLVMGRVGHRIVTSMSLRSDHLRSLSTLGLSRNPIAFAFTDEPLAGLAKVSRAEAAGCGYWRLAQKAGRSTRRPRITAIALIRAFTHGRRALR